MTHPINCAMAKVKDPLTNNFSPGKSTY